MANDILIRFVGEDSVTPAANKATSAINKVSSAAGKATKGTGALSAASGILQDKVGSLGGAIGSTAMQIGAAAGPYGIAAAAVIALGAGFIIAADGASKYNDQVIALKNSIVQLAGTKASGEALYSTLIDIAARTPFERQDVIEMGRALLSAGIAAEKVPGYVFAIGDAITTMRGSGADAAQAIESSTRAIARMYMQDKISMEQMNVLVESGIPAWKLLSEATGYSVKELMDLSSKGLLPATKNMDILRDAMTDTMGGAMASQTGTVTQAASNMNDAWNDLSATFGNAVSPMMVNLYSDLTDLIVASTKAGQAIYDLGTQFSNWSTSVYNSIPSVTRIKLEIEDATESTQSYIDTQIKAASSQALPVIQSYWESISTSTINAWNDADDYMTALYKAVNVYEPLENIKKALLGMWESTKSLVSETLKLVGLQEAIDGLSQSWDGLDKWIRNSTLSVRTFFDAFRLTPDQWKTLTWIANVSGMVVPVMAPFAAIVNGVNWVSSAADQASGKIVQGNNNVISSEIERGLAVSKGNEVIKSRTAAVLDVSDATKGSTGATRDNNDAEREAARVLAELTRNTKEYEDTIKDLRNSYMEIADAQRNVETAEKALADAMDPLKVQQMTLSIQSQSINMRELNESMDEMKARRAEIARALASQNEEQIKHNALTAEEHRQLTGLNKSLGSLKQERDAIRKALQSGNLTDEQRVEFLRTEQALNAAINQQTGEKKKLTEKQDAAVKKASEDRLKLIEEDKRLQADLEKSQIRAKQAIIDMQLAQKALAEAQDPKRLEEYKDAVTKAQTNLASLRLEQEQDRITADALAASIGVTSGATDALRQSALDTATPLDDLNTSSTNLNTTLSRPLGVNQSVTTTGDAIKGVSTYAASASTSLVGFNTVLGKLPDVKTKVDPLNDVATAMERIAALAPNFGSGMYDAVSQIKNAINGITGDGSSRWNSFSINFSAALKNATPSAIKNLVEALDAVNTAPGDLVSYAKKAQLTEAIGLYAKDNRLTRGEYEALTVGATGAEKAFIDAVIKSYGDKLKIDSDVPGVGTLFGIKPKSRLSLMNGLGMTLNTSTGANGGTLQGSTTDANGNVQNITINLNYATPPESNDPLGDVKRYLAAQGGRLRI